MLYLQVGHRGKKIDSAEALTDDVVNVLKVERKDVIIVFQDQPHMEIGMLQGFVFRKNNDISRKYYDMTCVNSKINSQYQHSEIVIQDLSNY